MVVNALPLQRVGCEDGSVRRRLRAGVSIALTQSAATPDQPPSTIGTVWLSLNQESRSTLTKSSGDPVAELQLSTALGPITLRRFGQFVTLLAGLPAASLNTDRDQWPALASVLATLLPDPLRTMLSPIRLMGLENGSYIEAATPSAGIEVALSLQREDQSATCLARASAMTWEALLARGSTPDAGAPGQNDRKMALCLPIVLARLKLSAHDLTRVAPGDLLRTAQPVSLGGQLAVELASVPLMAHLTTQGPLLIFATHFSHEEDLSMEPSFSDSEYDETSPAPERGLPDMHLSEASRSAHRPGVDAGTEPIQSLPSKPTSAALLMKALVEVIVEMRSAPLTLAELSGLDEGATLLLAETASREVTVRTPGGPPLAYGELVNVDGALGVIIHRV